VHEVRELFAEVAIALEKPANSFDELAADLIGQDFETKDDLRKLDWKVAKEFGLTLKVYNTIKQMLE
jgi:hypothetical protein